MFTYKILSGIDRKRIVAYFASVSEKQKGSVYVGSHWQVRIEPECIDEKSPLKLAQTPIIFEGNEDACTKAIEAYRMRFLSAGG